MEATHEDPTRVFSSEDREWLPLPGIPKGEAAALAHRIVQNPATAIDTLAREELGLDPSELGSPWGAAMSSFFAFVAGAGSGVETR